MTDDELEDRLRAHYQALATGPAPGTLHGQIEDALGRRRSRQSVAVLRRTALAAGLVAVVIVGVAFELRPGGFLAAPTTPPAPSRSATSTTTPFPSKIPPGPTATPSPSVAAAAVDQGGTFPGGGLWASQGSTLLISTDAGATWQRSPIPTSAALLPGTFVLDPQHAWSITVGPGSTATTGSPTDVLRLIVRRTTDGGQTWQASTVPGNYANTSPELVFADAEHGYLLAAAERASDGTSTVLRTDDGGTTWSVVGTSAWLGSEVSVSDASTLWAGGQQSAGGQFLQPVLDVSRDGGHTWQGAPLPGLTGDTETQCGGCYLAGPPLFLDPATGYVTVSSSDGNGNNLTRIYRTTDAGRTWTAVADQPVEASAAPAVLDADHWLLPVDNPLGLDATADGGATWHTLTTNGLANGGWIIWIGALGSGHAAAVVPVGNSYPGVAALYLTADGGTTWQAADLAAPGAPSASPAAPASPGASHLAACRASDVVASTAGWGAAEGTTYAPITLTLRATTPCLLPDDPEVALLDPSGRVVIGGPGGATGSIELQTTATLQIGWSSWCATPPPQPLTLRVDLAAGDHLAVTLPTGFSASCMGVASSLFVNSFTAP